MRGLVGWVVIVVGTMLAFWLDSWLLLVLVDGAGLVLLWDPDYAALRRFRR